VLNVPPKRVQGGWARGDRLACEIVGAEKVHEFLALLDFQPNFPGASCECEGDMKLELADGERTLALLSWHHTAHLRWRDGDWPGDAWLTDKSAAALATWIDREAGQQLEQAEIKGRVLRREWDQAIRTPAVADPNPAETMKSDWAP
jgi:hypothetical protein